MPAYRHYRLDGANRFTRAEWIEANDDEDAVRQVRDRNLSVPSELWMADRLVARIEPEP